MAEKIDKKDLKEPDKLQLFFLACREFVGKHRIRIYTGAGVFVLILLLVSAWYLYQLNYETNAGRLYTKTFESAMKPGTPAPDTLLIKGYKELIVQYPRSRAAVTAQYRLGNLYLGRHEIDSAIHAYQEFLGRAPKDADLVTLAYNGLGSCYESRKDFGKSLEFFEKAMQAPAAAAFEALTYGNVARIHEAMNNPSKAAEFYRKALAKTTDPLMTLYLKRKISLLG